MEKLLLNSAYNARWFIAGVAGAHTAWWYLVNKPKIHAEVFGPDGNGGKMLKIITDLTDEEMARLKHVRRLQWHWRGRRTADYAQQRITDQELSDRGINLEQEPYVEYVKRPPHDKYL